MALREVGMTEFRVFAIGEPVDWRLEPLIDDASTNTGVQSAQIQLEMTRKPFSDGGFECGW